MELYSKIFDIQRQLFLLLLDNCKIYIILKCFFFQSEQLFQLTKCQFTILQTFFVCICFKLVCFYTGGINKMKDKI